MGIDYKSNKQVEAQWSEKQPFLLEFDHGLQPQGWEEGLPGMKVGGRRKLVIPSRLAYGQGTVVYIVDLLAAEKRPDFSKPKTQSSARSGAGRSTAPAKTAGRAAKRSKRSRPTRPAADSFPRPRNVTVPSGPPPDHIVVKDLREGWGPVVKRNTWVAVYYVAVDYESHKPVEVQWGPGRAFFFNTEWAVGRKKWQRGLLGMRLGGRRKLIIPSNLAYGQGAVVYVADAFRVQSRPFEG
jgi:peptidylprolyl isomerase